MNQTNKNYQSRVFLLTILIWLCCLLSACLSSNDSVTPDINPKTEVIQINPSEAEIAESTYPPIEPVSTASAANEVSSKESLPELKENNANTNNDKTETTNTPNTEATKIEDKSTVNDILFGIDLGYSYFLGSNREIYTFYSGDTQKINISTISQNEYMYFANNSEIYRVKSDGAGFCKVFSGHSISPQQLSSHNIELKKIEDGLIHYTDTFNGIISNHQLTIVEDIFIGSDAYYNFYLRGNDQIYSVHWNKTLKNNAITECESYLYFSTKSGIDRVKQDGTGFIQLWSNPNATQILSGWGTSITKIENGLIYVNISSRTGGFVIRIRIPDNSLRNKDIPEKPLGIGTDGSEYYLDSNNKICILYEGAFWYIQNTVEYEGYSYFQKGPYICRVKLDGKQFEELYTPDKGVVSVIISKIEDGVLFFEKFTKYSTIEQGEIDLKVDLPEHTE